MSNGILLSMNRMCGSFSNCFSRTARNCAVGFDAEQALDARRQPHRGLPAAEFQNVCIAQFRFHGLREIVLKAFYTGFPDGRHGLRFLSVEGAHVVTIGQFQGTHTGTFMGVAPTHAKVSAGVMHLDRVSNGKIVEHSGQLDAAGLMQQIQAKLANGPIEP